MITTDIRKRLRLKGLVFAGIAFILSLFIPSIEGCAKTKNGDYINDISFSPDGKKIIFDRRKGESPRLIHIYDLETGELTAYQPPRGETWSTARYSFDGKKIVLSTMPVVEEIYDPENSQIAVMDPDGKNIKKITNTQGFKICPSFSHSGKKVIFCKAGMIRESGRTPAADYDVYEVDIETGIETRLTWFRFFLISSPYYFSDDKTFIFSAELPRSFPGVSDNDRITIKRMREGYKSMFKENTIFIMHGSEKMLKPYIELGQYSSRPLLTADGKQILFRAWAYKPDGSGDCEQFYLFSPDGKHQRLTYLKATTIWSGAVSPDGKLLAAVYDIAPKIRKIMIYNIKDGTSKEISLPDQPSRIINQRE